MRANNDSKIILGCRMTLKMNLNFNCSGQALPRISYTPEEIATWYVLVFAFPQGKMTVVEIVYGFRNV